MKQSDISRKEKNVKTVVIIGAGPAGLTAAYQLLSKRPDDYEVVIVEKDECVGGLSKSFTFNGNKIDIGGHRFFSRNPVVNRTWLKVLPFENGGMQTRPRASHIFYGNAFYEYPLRLDIATLEMLGMRTALQVCVSYAKERVTKKPVSTLEDFFIHQFGKKLYQLFFQEYTQKLWGVPASEMSADWGLQRVRKLSLLKAICQNKNCKTSDNLRTLTDEFLYPSFGSGQLWDAMASEVIRLGAKIILGDAVVSIDRKPNNVFIVSVEGNDNRQLTSDIVLSSMPLKELASCCSFCSKDIKQIASGLKYRDMVIVALDICGMDEQSLIGKHKNDSWVYIQSPDVKFGRIQILNNWSEQMVHDKKSMLLELEYYCDYGDDFWQLSDKELCDKAAQELKISGLCGNRFTVADSFARHIVKAYPIYNGSYDRMPVIKEWVNSVSDLYCIGRNGQHHYNNMDHSMKTAFEAVGVILGETTDKQRIWDVNSSEDYIEK